MTQSHMTHRPRTHWLGNALRHLLVVTLVVSIGPTASLFAQAAAVSQAVASTPMSLHITILEGEDSLNSIRERTAREPIVQVEDENHKPVAGALVLFSIQNGSSGAGGTFANGAQTLRVTTDANGRAVAHGLKVNQTEGSFAIGVTATLGTLVVVAQIRQSNVAGGGGGTPTTPGAPGAPGTPASPSTPATPTSPATPGAPGTPDTPGTPGTPGAPNTPSAPGAPLTPGTPASPGTPGTATTPATPGAPGGPGSPIADNPLPGTGSIGKKIGRFNKIPKKVYVTGGVVVSVGVVVGVVVATRSTNPTTITPGTGTVTGP